VKKAFFLVILFIVAIVALGYYYMANRKDIPAVKVFNVNRQDIASEIEATGVVSENNRSSLYTSDGIPVIKVNVLEGDSVKKGDVLASLDLKEYKSQLQKAELNFNTETINLNRLKEQKALENKYYSEKSFKAEELDLINKEKEFESAKDKYEMNKKLFETGATALSELNDSQKNMELAQRILEEAKATLEESKKQLENEKNLKIKELEAQIAIQANKVALCKIEIEELREKLGSVQLDTGNVIAVRDGIVSQINIIEGEKTRADIPMFTIIDNSKFFIDAKVNEKYINKVSLKSKVVITSDSIEEMEYEGVVANIAPNAVKEEVDRMVQNVVNVRIEVLSEDTTLLRPGFNVNVSIRAEEEKNVLAISKDALKVDSHGNKYIFVVNEGRIKKVYIEDIIESDMLIGIKDVDGIEEGSRVVYRSEGRLEEGISVNVIDD